MPAIIARLLDSSVLAPIARILLTLPFWASGLSKSFDFQGALAEMVQFNLHPPMAFAIATIVCQLAGSALVIVNRFTWLGAGALGVFTALTIPIAHDFWNLSGEKAQIEIFFFAEHIGLIGGLILAAILSRQSKAGGA